MGSQTPLKLPIIDFTTPGTLNQGSLEWDSLKVQVREALKEYGCFEAVYDELPPKLRKSHFSIVEELFNLPTDVNKAESITDPKSGAPLPIGLIAWANGHLYNAVHRVMMRGNITRYSTGLFSVPREGYVLKVSKELVKGSLEGAGNDEDQTSRICHLLS
ncbi:probable 2-oxoglutarate-dependent dioxygenase AOP1.2 [Tripterygium wilfordii]|uniref:probable 2-oxoglutarate-dependent dioxygenase AOP1.2 n=1 Tax=Tripterygium wilfordii TaxID=458696 RepID=UPI0018F82743|nr:probable 2-oxoglutarate-dependent dioxygenase AOP1.2 [Tripterygium wilfordii]